MNLDEAKYLAEKMMGEHNLKDWKFAFNNRKTANGLCDYRKKTIFLSKHATLNRNEEAVENTIIHEIAHALTEGEHHSHVWRNKFIELGGDGLRCSCDTFERPKEKYIYVCPKCARTHQAYRRWTRTKACGVCCEKYNNGKFTHDFVFLKVERK